METSITTAVLIVAAVAGFFEAYRKRAASTAVAEKNRALESELGERNKRIGELEEEVCRGRECREKVVRLETEIKNEREGHEREIKALKDAEQRLTKEFENIGNKIFEDKSETFRKQSKEGLENILNPLKEDIKNFKDKFAETDKDFAGKFGELKSQVEHLRELNKTIGIEAQNLTKALKGDSKQRGNWGEFVLEKALEISGLREGREYETQKSVSDEDGGRRVPDVIVHMPDEKDIVIDSKVSLIAYERYCSAESEEERAEFFRGHTKSVEDHIKMLGGKNYQNLHGIRTLNYVLMFIPIEPAYILAVNEGDMYRKALDRNVVLVCPSTLLAVLRTVHSLWQMEDRNANAQEIAEEAGKLYDKFVGFVSHMDKLRSQLDTAGRTFDAAYKSLSEGQGNIVRRAEKMKKLGARTSKSLPPNLVEQSGNGAETVE